MSDVRFEMTPGALDKFFASQEGGIAKGLLGVGAAVEGLAKIYCPVDTGKLRASIHTDLRKEIEGIVVYVLTTTDYAPPVEYGTIHMSARSFMRRAAHEVAGV